MTGRKEEAIEQLKKTLEMDPNFAAAHHGLAFSLSHEGRHGEAIAEMKRAIELAGDEPAWEADLAYVYGMAGQKDIARAVLNQLEKKSKQRFVPASDFAFAYLALGDNDRAFYWLERAYAAHEDYIALIKVYPELDPLRPDPRFQALVQRMNFPQ